MPHSHLSAGRLIRSLALVGACVTALLVAPRGAGTAEVAVDFPNFRRTDGLALDAGVQPTVNEAGETVLRFLPVPQAQPSLALTSRPIALPFDGSFSTAFRFHLGPPRGRVESPVFAGESLLFLLLPAPRTEAGQSRAFAVEFDSSPLGASANLLRPSEVAIDGFDVSSVARIRLGFPGSNPALWHAWIDYDGSAKHLEVRVSGRDVRPEAPTSRVRVDFPDGARMSRARVGFAATHDLHEPRRDVLSWRFETGHKPLGAFAPTPDSQGLLLLGTLLIGLFVMVGRSRVEG